MAAIDPSAIAQARAAGYSDQEIADHIAQDPGVKSAREAGYSDKEIIGHIMGDKPEASGTAAGLVHGVSDAGNALKETAKDYFGVGPGASNPDPNYVPADITGGSYNPLKWNYDQLPQKAAEIAPGLAQNIAAASAGAKAGKTIGGVKGAALGALIASAGSMWASTAGNAAKQDAVDRTGDTNATPNGGDLTRAGLTSAASAAAQSVLPTRFIPGANKVTAVGAQGALDGIKKYLATTGIAGAGGFVGNSIDQVGNSIGTAKGLQYDPKQAIDSGLGNAAVAGAIGAPQAVSDVTAAANRAQFGGANAQATAAYANRLKDAAGSDGLGTGVFGAGKRDFTAQENTKAGLRKELQAVDHSGMDQDTQNALSLARSGKPLTEENVSSIEQSDPTAGFLARQLRMAQQAESFGTYDTNNQSWNGGMSGKMDKLMRNYVDPTKVAVGAAAGKVMGLHLLGTASPAFAGAAAGTYGLARMADAMSGLRSPAKAFSERFADANAATRMQPPAPPAPPAPQSQPTPGPWGPRPLQQQSVPQLSPQAPAPAPQAAPPLSPMAIGMLKQKLKQGLPPAPAAPAPAPPQAPPLSPMAIGMLKQRLKQGLPPEPAAPAPEPPQAPQPPPISPMALGMLKQKLKLGLPPEPAAAPAPSPIDQSAVDAASLKGAGKSAEDMWKQKAWQARVMQNSAPPSPTPAPAAPQIPPVNQMVPPQKPVNPLMLPTDITKPAKSIVNGIGNTQDMKDAATAPPVVAAALRTKITKKSGGSVQVSDPAPTSIADILGRMDNRQSAAQDVSPEAPTAPAASPADSYSRVGAYAPITEDQMQFRGMTPGDIAKMTIEGRYSDLPALVQQSLRNHIVGTHAARDSAIAELTQQHPQDAVALQHLSHQLHEPGNSDQSFSRRAIKHYSSLMSPEAGKATRDHFDREDVKDAIWPKKVRTTKKKNVKTEATAQNVAAE